MRDIKGFVKLFDISIPDYENFDYYIKQYSKLPQWSHIYDLIKTYEDFENECDDVLQYKFGKANKLIEYLKNTHAYQEINCHPLVDLPTTKNFVYSEDKIYLSIDIIKANYSVMKSYDDVTLNELGNSYEDLLSKFDIHPIIGQSKGFRQFIFGNLNPKRQVKAQRVVIEELRKSLQHFGLEEICIKSDEVIYSIDNFENAKEIIDFVDSTKFKIKIFKVKKVEDFKLNTYYNYLGKKLESALVGCNGARYFIYLKTLILNEPLDIRDLLFKMDGKIAIWNVEGLKLELT
jgi:hypothetical protein